MSTQIVLWAADEILTVNLSLVIDAKNIVPVIEFPAVHKAVI